MSSAVPVSRISSSSSAGSGVSRCAVNMRCSVTESPSAAGIISARCTPAAASPASTRNTIPAFSGLPNTDAPATSRRMSRPDAGLATMPTMGGTLLT